jgi:uncharacterized membrane protein
VLKNVDTKKNLDLVANIEFYLLIAFASGYFVSDEYYKMYHFIPPNVSWFFIIIISVIAVLFIFVFLPLVIYHYKTRGAEQYDELGGTY